MIFSEGTNADCFYIVSKGTVEVVLPHVKSIGCHCAFNSDPGNISAKSNFSTRKSIDASVRASERGPVEVLCISYDQLSELLGESPITRGSIAPNPLTSMKRKILPDEVPVDFRRREEIS